MKKIAILPTFLTLFVLFFVIGYLIYPLFQLLLSSFAEKESYHQLFSSNILQAGFNSIFLSAITVLGSAIIGVYFAYLFQYTPFRFKPFFATLVLLPISIPPMVGVMAFYFYWAKMVCLRKCFRPKVFVLTVGQPLF